MSRPEQAEEETCGRVAVRGQETRAQRELSLCDALEATLTQAESASTQLLSAAVAHLLTTAGNLTSLAAGR